VTLGLFVDVGHPFDEPLLQRLTAIQARRLAHALG